jgi:chromosome segregation ATPase
VAGERTADKPQAEDGIGKKMAKGRYPNLQKSSEWLDGPNPSASGFQPAAHSGADNPPEISELRAQLQALRRTNTFMTAEIYELKQRQARQDEVEVLLADARSQITESNVRRKEMARVIGERDVLMNKLEAKLRDANSALDAASALNTKLQLDLKSSARELAASQSRRKEMVQVIRNRELKIERLTLELSQSVDRVTSLEQRLLRRSPSHLFARILGNIRRFFS